MADKPSPSSKARVPRSIRRKATGLWAEMNQKYTAGIKPKPSGMSDKSQ
jgi:hypothetical protein